MISQWHIRSASTLNILRGRLCSSLDVKPERHSTPCMHISFVISCNRKHSINQLTINFFILCPNVVWPMASLLFQMFRFDISRCKRDRMIALPMKLLHTYWNHNATEKKNIERTCRPACKAKNRYRFKTFSTNSRILVLYSMG